MVDDIQEYFNRETDKQTYGLGIYGVRLTGEITDLSEFTDLTSLEVSDTLITNTDLGFLDTLPNKEKLEKINFSDNQIQEIDFAQLFTNFPNLEKINLQNNPLSSKQLDKLSKEQFAKLVQGIKSQNIKIDLLLHPSKKTIAKDLLEYSKKLIAEGDTNAYQLQEFIQEKQPVNGNDNDKIPLIISCLIVFSVFVLVIGCWLRQMRRKTFYE